MLVLKAVDFAATQHRFQKRKGADASPYINHPIAVARLLSDEGGVTDEDILAAARLHDTIEDTVTSADDLDREFGEKIRKLVEEVTDDKNLEKAERKRRQVKHAKELSPGATLVKLADKISNVLDVTHNPPEGWSVERRQEYLDWSEKVVRNCPQVHEGLLQAFNEALASGRRQLESKS
jgi:guanosine-3',5'-bis(diphosphate) 3'-pyrophosphohydrolase